MSQGSSLLRRAVDRDGRARLVVAQWFEVGSAEHKVTGDTTTAYGYPAVNANGAGQPHTMTSVTVNGGAAKSYTYDEQGNTTQRYGPTGTAQSLTWDIEGELTRLTEGTKSTDYLYDANGELLIRRGPAKTVLYLAGQELHYDTAAQMFTAQRYYPAGDATAVRTETGLSWMVDDHHGTASMTVDATTQAVTRRYTKPFGEARGATPSVWPDDKGFLGKPADADTGLTHVGAREYDPPTGRFLSVDPILAPDDHESLNGYAYANNTPVTKSDPTGLRPITACEQGCSDGKGGSYHDHLEPNGQGGWTYHSTQTYSQSFQYQKQGGGTGSGTMTVTIRTDGGQKSAQVVFKKGPDPKPERRDGSQCRSCWAMGTNPYYDPNPHDLPDRPKLATWQKVVLGVVVGVAAAVVAAPVAALGEGCLATAPVCAAEIAEMATGGASGGSLTVGSGAALAATSRAAKGADSAQNVVNGDRLADALRWESAGSMFNKDGTLTEEAIKNSRMIQPGSKMGNPAVVEQFEARGGVGQWGKYTTERHQAPNGMNFEVHFYMNEKTGEVLYYDYKAKFPDVYGGQQ